MPRPLTLRAFLTAKRGRITLLAHCLGVSVPLVSMWLHGTRRVPAERVQAVYQRTGVKPEQIRKDVFGRKR